MNKPITKDIFLNTLRCNKAAFLSVHHPELKEEKKDMLTMQNAVEFEKVACEMIAPNGINLRDQNFGSYNLALITKQHLAMNDSCSLYQATFVTRDNEVAMADILVKAPFRTALYEVKSFTGPLEAETMYDVAYQYWIITKAGCKVDQVSIVYVNNNYVREGKLTSELLVIEDVTQEVLRLQSHVNVVMQRLQKTIGYAEAPHVEIGRYCLDPRPCAFKNHCWDHLPANNVFQLRGMRIGSKLNLYQQNIVEFKDIPATTKMSDRQWIQVSCALENKIVVQPEPIRKWLSKVRLDNGLYYMDFETYSCPIPKYGKPYRHTPFQFSLHYSKGHASTPTHYEFLADPLSHADQELLFLETLVKHTGLNPKAKIVVWNATFERSVLNKLALRYPEYESQIESIVKRLEDLMIVFRDYYSDARFAGSFSIKAVLPVICPELSYEKMSIGDGSTASYEYLRLRELGASDSAKVKQALLAYCHLDTLALVKILDFLIREFKTSTNN